MKKGLRWLLSAVLFLSVLSGCTALKDETELPESDEIVIEEDGWYSSKEEVAAYLKLYEHLPDNYLTKQEARDLGWDSEKGNLWDVAEGMSIGGDKFGNREGLLPKEKGRQYYECDIDYEGGYRNGKRIVYSNDGLIFYTEDHYESFEEIVGEK
ncbi:MAG: ribonuclease [Erysipelotrichaceae bacterium]|nr:ribonuclease [Erysipelotrichaceae bacterium]